MQLEDIADRYPEVKGINGWVHISPGGARIDAYLMTDELRKVANVIEQIDKGYVEYFKRITEIDPTITEDVNGFWQAFGAGKTHEEAIEQYGQYGRRKDGTTS